MNKMLSKKEREHVQSLASALSPLAYQLNGFKHVFHKLANINPRLAELSNKASAIDDIIDLLNQVVNEDVKHLQSRGIPSLKIHAEARIEQLDKQIAALRRKNNEDRNFVQRKMIELAHAGINPIQAGEQVRAMQGIKEADDRNYQTKKNELASKGFSENEIIKIIGFEPVLDEYQFFLKHIEPLETEKGKLEAFMVDYPRFDLSLLVGTALEPMVENHKQIDPSFFVGTKLEHSAERILNSLMSA